MVKHQDIGMDRRMEVLFHALLAPDLHGGEWLVTRLDVFTFGAQLGC